MLIRWNIFTTRFGTGAFACTESGVCSVMLPQENWVRSGQPALPGIHPSGDSVLLLDSSLEERDYFESFFQGDPELHTDSDQSITPPIVDWDFLKRHRTPFQQKVLRACYEIPKGRVETYGSLATRSGVSGAARAAGSVMATNPVPLLIPCHRVVRQGGNVGQYGGGAGMKTWLLQSESALFTA
jgi:O-6-methylguanine DNA methyltransferase